MIMNSPTLIKPHIHLESGLWRVDHFNSTPPILVRAAQDFTARKNYPIIQQRMTNLQKGVNMISTHWDYFNAERSLRTAGFIV